MPERRQHLRFKIALSVSWAWCKPGEDLQHTGEGVVRDISTAGLFVRTAIAPEAGTIVHADVDGSPFVSPSRLHLEMSGPVLRVEGGDEPGFAISATTFAAFEVRTSDAKGTDNEHPHRWRRAQTV